MIRERSLLRETAQLFSEEISEISNFQESPLFPKKYFLLFSSSILTENVATAAATPHGHAGT